MRQGRRLSSVLGGGVRLGEKKKLIKENHIKEFGGRDAPEASQGQIRDVPETPGTFGPDLCVNQY